MFCGFNIRMPWPKGSKTRPIPSCQSRSRPTDFRSQGWKVQRWSCILWGEGIRSITKRIHIKNGDMVELYDESNTSMFHHFLSKLRYFMIKSRRFQQQLTTGEAKDGTQECVDITCLVWKQNKAPPSSLISSDLRWPSCYSSEEAPDKTSHASNLYTNHQPDPGQDCILVVFNLRFVCFFHCCICKCAFCGSSEYLLYNEMW